MFNILSTVHPAANIRKPGSEVRVICSFFNKILLETDFEQLQDHRLPF